MSQTDLRWLVKSSGRILGPFPAEKVVELLRSREISVLDEVAQAQRRWLTIQYHDEFREVVDNLRKANLSERTEATWTVSSGTLGQTQTLTDLSGGDLTDEISGVLDGFSSTAKEIVVHNVVEQVQTPQPNQMGRFQPTAARTTAVQQKVEKTTRGLWGVTALVLLGTMAFIGYRKFGPSSLDSRIAGGNIKQAVVNNVQMGHYEAALRDLRARFSDPMQAGDLAIYYGSLLIQVEGQTMMGRRILNQVIAARRPESKQAYTAIGVADLIDGQLDAAQENFEVALAMEADYVPALVNVSALQMQKGNYAAAKKLAQRALKLSPYQGEALLLWAEVQLYLFKSDKDLAGLNEVSRKIKEFVGQNWDFQSELGFYALYFDVLRKDRDFEENLQRYLDNDPSLTEDHRHNVFIYKGRAQWKVLARLCEQLGELASEAPRISTLIASCSAHEGRWDSARRHIEKAVHSAPKDPLIQAWYSYILRESGDGDQASVVLGRAKEADRRGEYVLPTLLQARFCYSVGLLDCARDNWQRIYEHNLDYLPAIAGLAIVQSRNRAPSEAVKLINKGLRRSPDYIPLLELRQRAESEGWYVAK